MQTIERPFFRDFGRDSRERGALLRNLTQRHVLLDVPLLLRGQEARKFDFRGSKSPGFYQATPMN